MIKLTIIAAACLFAPGAWAKTSQRTVHGSTLQCADVLDDAHSLQVKAQDGKTYNLVEYEFEAPPFLTPTLGCAKWLETWWRVADGKLDFELVPLLDARQPAARLIGTGREQVNRVCRADPRCHMSFPYWLTAMGMSPVARWEPLKRLARDACFEPLPPPATRPTPTLAAIHQRSIDDVTAAKFSWSPQTSFADELVKSIKDRPGDTLIASTMTLSRGELRAIAAAAEATVSRVVILFDLTPTIYNRKITELLQFAGPNVFFVPIFGYAENPETYHVKGATSLLSGDETLVTSLNMTNAKHVWLVDLIGRIKSEKLATAMRRVLVGEWSQVCEQAPTLSCSLDARFERGDSTPHIVRRELYRSCALLAGDAVNADARLAPEVGFHSYRDAVPGVLETLIKESTSIVGTAHRWGRGPWTSALTKAAQRGVHVEIYAGDPAAEDEEQELEGADREAAEGKKEARGWLRRSGAEEPEPHTKALVFDDRYVWWGSGNFTRSGLTTAREVFWLFDSPLIKAGILRLVATVRALNGELPAAASVQPAVGTGALAQHIVWDPAGAPGAGLAAEHPVPPRLDYQATTAAGVRCRPALWGAVYFLPRKIWEACGSR